MVIVVFSPNWLRKCWIFLVVVLIVLLDRDGSEVGAREGRSFDT